MERESKIKFHMIWKRKEILKFVLYIVLPSHSVNLLIQKDRLEMMLLKISMLNFL